MTTRFEQWAKKHLGQGYPLDKDDHAYIHPVTRWAAKAYKAAVEDTCLELRKIGDESKTLKVVFDSIATELKERLNK